ncbi:MAG: hypothetical protein H6Q13_2812 [Bacteroidetes bacterium]|nr:hypothetical protein [Bacteroidota bacterium]
MKSLRLLSLCALFCIAGTLINHSKACTSFIVSGKATPDGRPFLFKNRDTNDLNNLMAYFKGPKYDFVGDISANPKSKSIWFGHNSAGFAIMNTAAYNLNGKESDDPQSKSNPDGGCDGLIMKQALGQCATLKDFENMLDTMAKPLCCNSNYGVIDANGGCAYYETGNKGYVKFDANDTQVAPYGYLVRTNHGFSGDRSMDKGISRFNAISGLCLSISDANQFTVENILTNIPRYLTHGLTKLNLYDNVPANSGESSLVAFRDYIPRYLTASAALIQGVKPGESPLLTVSWTIIGSPMATVAVPVCITPSGKIPALLSKDSSGKSPLCNWGLSLKRELFPITRGEGADYLDLSKLVNQQGNGIMQKVELIEKEVVAKGQKEIEKARKNGKFDKSIDEYYSWADTYITQSYQSQFPEIF